MQTERGKAFTECPKNKEKEKGAPTMTYYERHKEERRAYAKEHYKKKRDELRVQRREYYWNNRKDRIAYQKRYYQEHRDEKLRKDKEYYYANREKRLAKKYAYTDAPIKSQCEKCGSTENLERHHPDYSKPLEIVTLCRSCHTLLHSEIKY